MKAALTGTAFPKPANYETFDFLRSELFSLYFKLILAMLRHANLTFQNYPDSHI